MRVLWLLLFFVAAPALADGPGRLTIKGVAEMRFNSLTGTLKALSHGASLAADDPDVQVFVNDQPVDDAAIKITRDTIEVDYEFIDGVNDLLITARDENGQQLRGDAIVWAGSHTLIVDVVDAEQNPIDGATVSIKLASGTGIQSRATSVSGTARIEHLPNAALVVSVAGAGGQATEIATSGDAGTVLVIVP